MEIGLVVEGVIQDRAAVERSLGHVLGLALESQAGELNVVLTARSDGYEVFSAQAVFGRASKVDYSKEVRAALDQAGVATVDAHSRG